ncbi:MarR family winged helix-turn-helix transcriptional regulator [Streptosporangium sp. NPDC000396]|uniref:MarR family winged helix-turn-helix transcriptional regulator n=1 Tax=Streptosporangium sp. NPDC000396 TaxID=3366185 RepID=UPI00369B5FBF
MARNGGPGGYRADSGSLIAAELARHLQVSPASISKAVAELEQQKLIRRERDPADGATATSSTPTPGSVAGWSAPARTPSRPTSPARSGNPRAPLLPGSGCGTSAAMPRAPSARR